MSSEVRQVTVFSKKPRCPKCDSMKGMIVGITTTVYEEEIEEGKTEEDTILMQDMTIECPCGVTYEANYISIPLASSEIKILDQQKGELSC